MDLSMSNRELFSYFLTVLKNVNLSKNKFFSTKNISDDIFDRLPRDFSYDWAEGETKLVIIPFDYNWVIKIPYNGYAGKRMTNGTICHYADYFDYGSTDIRHFWDYCYTESCLYQKARTKKIAEIFAKEIYIGSINGYPIYAQQKAEGYDMEACSFSELKITKEESEYLGSILQNNDTSVGPSFTTSTYTWLADVLIYYGRVFLNKVLSFIKKNEISDLHSGNVGYINNRPVIIDYSSFHG